MLVGYHLNLLKDWVGSKNRGQMSGRINWEMLRWRIVDPTCGKYSVQLDDQSWEEHQGGKESYFSTALSSQ